MEVKKRLGIHYCKNEPAGSSLLVQWLTILAPSAEGLGLTPDQRTKIPHATCHGQKKKKLGWELL